MNVLRRLPLSRLLLACVVMLVVGATATAVAASLGGFPKPAAPKPLAAAVHDALSAPAIQGVSADISFTNKLIDGASIQGKNPLLTGATGRVWLSNDGRARLELQSNRGDTQILYDGQTVSYFDTSSGTEYRLAVPASHAKTGAPENHKGVPTVASIQQTLSNLMSHATVSGAVPSDVAGHPTYQVRISPQHDGGLLGAAELEWDSVHGAPLRLAVYAANRTDPVLELKATKIQYGPVRASAFTLPRARKVVDVKRPGAASPATHSAGHRDRHHAKVSGQSAVQAALPFRLSAPAGLDQLTRQSVELLDMGGHPAALVTYGKGLGGIAVIEQAVGGKDKAPSGSSSTPSPSDSGHGGSSALPTVSINGNSGSELATALGTLVRFQRGGVSYIVLGSVPPLAAEQAARGL